MALRKFENQIFEQIEAAVAHHLYMGSRHTGELACHLNAVMNLLIEHEAVKEVAAIGLPHERLGEEVAVTEQPKYFAI